jgi:hypothetical protein
MEESLRETAGWTTSEVLRAYAEGKAIEYGLAATGMMAGGIKAVGARLRNVPGTASGSIGISNVEGTWLRGTHGSAGRMPGQIARQLEGRSFRDFDHFRGEFWKAVANDPDLSAQFRPSNVARMREGLAPYAPSSQQVGELRSYVLHHKTPINQSGGVYDLRNIDIVSPRYHQEVLSSTYHYGK